MASGPGPELVDLISRQVRDGDRLVGVDDDLADLGVVGAGDVLGELQAAFGDVGDGPCVFADRLDVDRGAVTLLKADGDGVVDVVSGCCGRSVAA